MELYTRIVKFLAFACCAAFVFLIPFGWQSANYILGSFALFAVVNPDLWKNWKSYRFSYPEKAVVLVTLAYLVWEFVSMIWTDDTSYGMTRIVRHIPIFAMPVLALLASVGGVIKRPWVIIQFLCAGTLSSMILCLIMSYYDCWHLTPFGDYVFGFTVPEYGERGLIESITSGYSHFSYFHLSHFINPAYFALFVNILMIYSYVILYKYAFSKRVIALSTAIIVFGALFLVMLCNRANFISFSLIVAVIGIYEWVVKKHKRAALIIFSVIMLITGGVLSTGRGQDMVSKITKSVTEEQDTSQLVQNSNLSLKDRKKKLEKVNDRVSIWGSAFRVILKRPILGCGVGDSDDAIIGQYYIDGKIELADSERCTHNQYLDIWLECGVLGFIILMALVLLPLVYGFKYRNIALILFSLTIVINLMFETMLNRSVGCFSITLVMMLMLISEIRNVELKQGE